MKAPKHFATEVDLCARFLSALPKGWTPYAETAGWDILLSRDRDGFQIGIQAKLKLNVGVICQALEQHSRWWATLSGPDCRAVLVPEGESRLGPIADYIGITVIRVRPPPPKHVRYAAFSPDLPDDGHTLQDEWHEWAPAKRETLPSYVPDVAAGSSAPVQLTEWKIAAMKIAITLELRGFVTREDFKEHKIDHRRWMASGEGWLQLVDGRLVGHRMPDFKTMHPRNYAEILADAEKWMLKLTPPATTGRLFDKAAR